MKLARSLDRSNVALRLASWLLALTLFLFPIPQASAQNHDACPGTIIDEIPAPDQILGIAINPIYVSDPCILVLSNGDFLASHAQFGSASGSATNGTTRVFRSTDKGETWARVNAGKDLTGILRGTLFEHSGAVYLLGANKDTSGNMAVMFKSTDNGDSWTPASFTSFGGMATPDNVLTFNNRLWAAATRSSFSCATGSDPFLQASWTSGGGFPTPSDAWLPGTGFIAATNFIGEGQITASPGQGLVILPKVRLLPYTAIARVNPVTGAVAFDPDQDFVPLPGGEKKFGARFDAVSGRYFILANPNLPAHDGSSLAPDLKRNTAAVLTSRDLRHWTVEKIVLYSANIDYEGFQYFNFDIDGEDLVVASRTAFDVGGNKPPRGHDSNLLTFHRIPNFRSLAPEHVLRIESGQVRRYEKTQHAAAPLGVFAQGNSFAGSPLTNPTTMGLSEGAVYIQEAGGRILRFDLAGNFLGAAPSAPGPMQSGELPLPQPPAGECFWTAAGSGTWNEPRNWYYWNRPGDASRIAVFGTAATNGSVTVSLPSTARSWNFDSDGNFEGWQTTRVTSAAVSGGVLRGNAQDGDPVIQRLNLNFSGSEVTGVRVRMRVNAAGNVPVDLYWGNWSANAFADTRSVRAEYTGNNQFQDVVFAMAGRPGWDGERITRLRIDPVNGSSFTGVAFEIADVSVPLEYDDTRLAGLRFFGTASYALTGTGRLRIQPGAGLGLVDVQQGTHNIGVPFALGTNTTVSVAAGSSLQVSGVVTGSGDLTKLGDGTLLLSASNTCTGSTIIGGGTLSLDRATLADAAAVRVATGATLRLEHGLSDVVGELWLDGKQKWKGVWGPVGSSARYHTTSLAGSGSLLVTGGPEPGYEGWAWEKGLPDAPAPGAALSADPDHDGIPNLLEWVLGGNPLSADASTRAPAATLADPHFFFRFFREDESEASADCVVQYSTNLLDWTQLPVGTTTSSPDAAGVSVTITERETSPDEVTAILPLTLASGGRLFVRLSAQEN